jgi:hypothetical protein
VTVNTRFAEGPAASVEQAFTKAYTDPRNRDVVRREHQRRMAMMGTS